MLRLQSLRNVIKPFKQQAVRVVKTDRPVNSEAAAFASEDYDFAPGEQSLSFGDETLADQIWQPVESAQENAADVGVEWRGYLGNANQGGLTDAELHKADQLRRERVHRATGKRPAETRYFKGGPQARYMKQMQSLEKIKDNVYISHTYVPMEVAQDVPRYIFEPHNVKTSRSLRYIPRAEFLAKNPSLQESTNKIRSVFLTNQGVSPRYLLTNRLACSTSINMKLLATTERVLFMILTQKLSDVIPQLFSRKFFTENRDKQILSGTMQQTDFHNYNLKQLYIECREVDFNQPMTNDVYDRLHCSREYPDGDCFGTFQPIVINACADMDGMQLKDLENSYENFRNFEIGKYKGLVNALHTFEQLITRCIVEEVTGLVFCREPDDLSIIEYFQYLYNLYHSEAFDWCRGLVQAKTGASYEMSPLLYDYLRKLESGEIVSAHAWRDTSGLTNKYMTRAQLEAKQDFRSSVLKVAAERFERSTEGVAVEKEEEVVPEPRPSINLESMDEVGFSDAVPELGQDFAAEELKDNAVSLDFGDEDGFGMSDDFDFSAEFDTDDGDAALQSLLGLDSMDSKPVEPAQGSSTGYTRYLSKTVNANGRSIQTMPLHFYNSNDRAIDDKGQPIPEFVLQYREPTSMDPRIIRKPLSSLPQYSTGENFNPVTDIHYPTESAAQLMKPRIARFHEFPLKNSRYLPHEEADFDKLLRLEIKGSVENIVHCETPDRNELTLKIEEFMNRYYFLVKTKIKTIFDSYERHVSRHDPLWCEAQTQLQGGKRKLQEKSYFLPGGIKENFKHVNFDKGWISMAYSMELLSNMLGGNDSAAALIASEVVFAPWDTASRSQLNLQENKTMLTSKLFDNTTIMRIVKRCMEQNMVTAYSEYYDVRTLQDIFFKILKPYYKEAHLEKYLYRPKTEMLETSDYMFLAYYNDYYLRHMETLKSGISTLLNDLSKVKYGLNNSSACISVEEDPIGNMVDSLFHYNMSDTEMLQKLGNAEKLDDDTFLREFCSHEFAVENMRRRAWGSTCSTDTMPNLVPPLPQIGNVIGGNLVKTQFNMQMYNSVENAIINNYMNKQKVDNYYSVAHTTAEESYAENMLHSLINDVGNTLDTNMMEIHRDMRILYDRTGAWNEKIRIGSNYLPFPCFTTKMLKRFISHDAELAEIESYGLKYNEDEIYTYTCKPFKKQLDLYWIEGAALTHMNNQEANQRSSALNKIHNWSFSNNQSEWGIANRMRANYQRIAKVYEELVEDRGKPFEDRSIMNSYYSLSFCDFRGRMYGYGVLNPTNQKVSRALIGLAKPYLVNEHNGSKYWLYVQMANMAGWDDKNTNDARFRAVEERMDFVLRIGKDPLSTIHEWDTLDNPWQSITTAMHIYKYHEAQRKGEDYYCNTPIYQDGTCNGLQHYGAMSRSELMCKYVNLAPAEMPQDIYGLIAERMREKIESDFEMGKHQLPEHLISKVNQLMTRGMVKRPIMTLPYGSCGYGWEEMLRDTIIQMVSNGEIEIDVHGILTISKFLRIKIESVIRDTLNEVIEHQRWLSHLVSTMNRTNAPVRWTSPLGTPLAMRNFKLANGHAKQKTFLPWTLIPYLDTDPEYVDIFEQLTRLEFVTDGSKALSGFSPNLIHSLDGAHMKLCMFDFRMNSEDPSNSTWIMIHDSFGVRACDIPTFSDAIRGTMVDIWSFDHRNQVVSDMMASVADQREKVFDMLVTLQDTGKLELHEGIENRLLAHYDMILEDLNQVPGTRGFKIENVKDSQYFFS